MWGTLTKIFSKSNQKYWLLLLLVVLFVVAYTFIKKSISQKQIIEQYSQTLAYNGKQDSIKLFKLNDSLSVYRSNSKDMFFSIKQLKTQNSSLLSQISALKIKNKDLESFTNISTDTKDTAQNIPTVTKHDSVSNAPTFLQATYRDEYLYVQTTMQAQNIQPNKVPVYVSKFIVDRRDSIAIIDYKKYHSILFGIIHWNTTYNTLAFSYNPHEKITVVRTTKIVK